MTNGSAMSQNADQATPNSDDDGLWKKRLLLLMVVALLGRITAAVLIERYVENAGRQFLVEGDANGYWELAQNIAAGKDYAIHTPPRYVLRVPGFPMLLAASIRLFGDDVLTARIVLAVAGTVCCWLTGWLGCRLHSCRVGFWAAVFVTFNPLHVGSSVLILSETWFTLWMQLSLLALWSLFAKAHEGETSVANPPPNCDGRTCTWRLSMRAVFTGVIIGLTVLVRPGYLPWLCFSCLGVLLFMRRSRMTRKVVCAGLVVGCFLALLPWAARNASVTGHWVFTSLWSGPSLYDGLNPNATGASDMSFFDEELVMTKMSEFEMNEHYKSRAFDFAVNNPGRVAELALRKLGMVLTPVPNFANRKGWEVSAVCVAFWIILLACCVWGLKNLGRDGIGLLLMAGPLLQFLLVHMVFVGSVRYRLPLEFPLAVLGAIGWQSVLHRREDKV